MEKLFKKSFGIFWHTELVEVRLKSFYLLFAAFTLFSCKESSEKKVEYNMGENEIVSLIDNPTDEHSSLPRLFSNGNELYLSWVSQLGELSILNYSKYSEGKWQPTEEIISGSDWFVNWADFPQIVENNGTILTSFLQKSADGKYTYDVKLNLYNDSTKTWKRNFILHKDGTQSEHGFVSIEPYVYNSFFITWLDGRNTTGGHESHGEGNGAMTLRGAIVFDDGNVDYDILLDDKVCDCCNTATAIGPDNELIVAYRDRSDDEIRDISIKRWIEQGGWQPSVTVGNDNWKIAGCPVNGPAIDIYQNVLGVAWFTAADDEGKVQIAFSDENREHFSDPIRVDSGNATGRVDIEMLSTFEAAVLWMEPQGEDEVIQLVKVDSRGEVGKPITISKTSSERASGFPQLEKVGNQLFVAWTISTDANSKIEMASISLDSL